MTIEQTALKEKPGPGAAGDEARGGERKDAAVRQGPA